jgi:SAM-dependent methyltransferase
MNITSGDIFLDVGCGKGRAMIAAAFFPFKKIIGIDISKRLIEYAKKNDQRRRKFSETRTFCLFAANICDWAIPDDVNVIFMYNPFAGEVMKSFLARVRESFERRPRVIKLIYVNPKCDAELMASGWLEKKRTTTPSLVGRVNFYQTLTSQEI